MEPKIRDDSLAGSGVDSRIITMKNISEKLLNVDADTLAERCVRGDESRSTEGSGLGLSISKMLTELMKLHMYLFQLRQLTWLKEFQTIFQWTCQ